jgi:two-component system, OmpR family, catabolic regulation response regulator CreB
MEGTQQSTHRRSPSSAGSVVSELARPSAEHNGAGDVTLVVEDDPDYADIISYTLKRDAHDVVVFDTATRAVAFAARKPVRLAVLDVMLPDATGLELCGLLRRLSPDLPILFVSSLDASSDVVAGLNQGGDDYLTKPFHPSELVARTRAVLRRARIPQPSAAQSPQLTNRGIEIDTVRQQAFVDGNPLDCTRYEVDILAQLIQYPGQALSHGFLTEQVWGYSNVQDASLLKGHMSSIRKKIRQSGGREDLIRTVHGVGYSYTPL